MTTLLRPNRSGEKSSVIRRAAPPEGLSACAIVAPSAAGGEHSVTDRAEIGSASCGVVGAVALSERGRGWRRGATAHGVNGSAALGSRPFECAIRAHPCGVPYSLSSRADKSSSLKRVQAPAGAHLHRGALAYCHLPAT